MRDEVRGMRDKVREMERLLWWWVMVVVIDDSDGLQLLYLLHPHQ